MVKQEKVIRDVLSDILSQRQWEQQRCVPTVETVLHSDGHQYQRVIVVLECDANDGSVGETMSESLADGAEVSLFPFMDKVITHLREMGKVRTSETYATTLKSFKRFRQDKDVPLGKIDSDMMWEYEVSLKGEGLKPNTISFYMRILRAVYNRAVEQQLTAQRFPFKRVYTGVEETVKRAVPLKTVKHIKDIDLSRSSALAFARDMFMFSFYTRGMAFVDMAYLRKSDLCGSILSYRRRKTGQQLTVKWERCMQEIVDKYDTAQSPYLLPIIKPQRDLQERKQYLYAAQNINRSLKIIGIRLGLPVPLTMYVSRHAWASIARSKKVPLSVISEGLGHDSEATTRIYLASLDTLAIDRANKMILKSLR